MVTTLLPHYETADVRIEKIVVGPFENNVFVLRSKSNGDAVIIDAANEHELLLEVSKRTGVRRVLTTHGHFDHIQAVTQMRDAGIDVGIAAEDAKMLPSYDFVIPDDDVIEVGDLRLRTIHTPGHTPGSTCFLLEGHPIVFSGDTLFPGGAGQHDVRGRRLRHDHPVDRPPPVHAAGRHARAPRPRSRHDDRERVAASRRVDRARLVAAHDARQSNGCLSRDGDDVYFETRRRARRAGRRARPRRRRQSRDLVPTGARVRARRTASITWDQRGFGTRRTGNGLANPRTATTDLLAILDHLGSSARTSSASRWAAGPRWASRSRTAIACGASCSPTRSRGIAVDGLVEGRRRDRAA